MDVHFAALGTDIAGVSNDIEETGDNPSGAKASGRDGEAEARNEQGAEEGDLVLGVVVVGALGWSGASSQKGQPGGVNGRVGKTYHS